MKFSKDKSLCKIQCYIRGVNSNRNCWVKGEGTQSLKPDSKNNWISVQNSFCILIDLSNWRSSTLVRPLLHIPKTHMKVCYIYWLVHVHAGVSHTLYNFRKYTIQVTNQVARGPRSLKGPGHKLHKLFDLLLRELVVRRCACWQCDRLRADGLQNDARSTPS